MRITSFTPPMVIKRNASVPKGPLFSAARGFDPAYCQFSPKLCQQTYDALVTSFHQGRQKHRTYTPQLKKLAKHNKLYPYDASLLKTIQEDLLPSAIWGSLGGLGRGLSLGNWGQNKTFGPLSNGQTFEPGVKMQLENGLQGVLVFTPQEAGPILQQFHDELVQQISQQPGITDIGGFKFEWRNGVLGLHPLPVTKLRP